MAPDAPNWLTRRSGVGPPQPAATALHTYLLDADDDLATQFDLRTRLAVRQSITVRVVEAPPGGCDLSATLHTLTDGIGLLVLDGLIVYEAEVGERTAAELIGAGDLIQPSASRADAMLDRRERWQVLWPTRLGLLDWEFAERVRPWPQITHALLRRASRRTGDLDAIRAISCHPRLEVRLDLIFWHLSARWGRVEPSGIRLRLPLTHRQLGELVAAERPSISHALSRLTQAGLITGSPGDWHLLGTPEEHLDALIERTVRLTSHSSGPGPPPMR